MSYDIELVPRWEHQSWEAALRAADEAMASPPPPDMALRNAWHRLADAMATDPAEIDRYEAANGMELTHLQTGVKLRMFVGRATVTVPFWHEGDDATAVMDRAYGLATMVANELGFAAYDTQLAAGVDDLDPALAGKRLAAVTKRLRGGSGADGGTKPRKWWPFGR